MIYFTSDLHFGHNKEFLYQPRGFKTIEEMNKAIAENWNNIVTDNDEVYVLGDLMLNDNAAGAALISQLRGKLHIVLGNHDTDARIAIYNSLDNVVDIQYATVVKHGKWSFYCSHYPTIVNNYDFRKFFCLHGHSHSTNKFEHFGESCYNVALDAHNCTPVSIEQIIADIKEHHEHITL